jgi:AcrR family transcriptional regulator
MGETSVADERVGRSKSKVLEAAGELLLERGYAGVSVDEITRRSGVAKTTIYRHWPTRTSLMREACAAIGTPLETPDLGNLKSDLVALAQNLAKALTEERWPSVLPSVIDAAERDPDIAEMYAELQRGYSDPCDTILRRALARGELHKDTDIAAWIAALTGPLFFRRWFSREPLTPEFAKRIVEQLCSAAPGARGERGHSSGPMARSAVRRIRR